MNKKLIAIAITGALAAPLAANAEVTITGQLQQELVQWDGDSATLDGLQLDDGGEFGNPSSGNASALGVAVAEDLGGGLKALGKWNMNTSLDEGGNVSMRDAYVGIAGGFGTVLAGRMNTPYKSSTVKWDPFLATFMQARGNGGMSGAHNGYANNVLAYANKFGPIKLVVGVSLDESADPGDPTKTSGDNAYTASVNLPVGPLEVAVAYLDNTAVDEGQFIKAGVKFTSGPITVAVQAESLGEDVGDGSMAFASASYKGGSNTFSVSAGAYSADNTVGGTPAFADDATYAAIGVNHAFSKSTSLHVGYRTTDAGDGGDESAIGAGLRVKF